MIIQKQGYKKNSTLFFSKIPNTIIVFIPINNKLKKTI